jgi:predicted nucleotide-binding protein
LAIFFINNIEPKTFNSNQLFELGYLFGKLGREKIFLLTDSNSKIPSDLAGMYFIDKNEDYWKYELIKRLDYSGISFDKQVLEFIK